MPLSRLVEPASRSCRTTGRHGERLVTWIGHVEADEQLHHVRDLTDACDATFSFHHAPIPVPIPRSTLSGGGLRQAGVGTTTGRHQRGLGRPAWPKPARVVGTEPSHLPLPAAISSVTLSH